MKTIAFIGLGNMGGPMAANLVKAGFKVQGFDLIPESLAKFTSIGGVAMKSAAETVAGADFVISMLPASKHVEDLYIGKGNLIEAIKPGTLVIDCSTIAPEVIRKVALSAFEKRKILIIDAPVSGGTGGAIGGTLTFMVGGGSAQFENAKTVLTAMGKNFFHAGDVGAGQIAKICNNMLLAIHMTGTSEALALGTKLGMNPNVLSEIMAKSSGRNWSLEVYNPYPGCMDNVPSSREYTGGFAVDLMAKDLGLAVEAANQVNCSTPLGALTTSLYRSHSAQGAGRLDFSSIIKFLNKLESKS